MYVLAGMSGRYYLVGRGDAGRACTSRLTFSGKDKTQTSSDNPPVSDDEIAPESVHPFVRTVYDRPDVLRPSDPQSRKTARAARVTSDVDHQSRGERHVSRKPRAAPRATLATLAVHRLHGIPPIHRPQCRRMHAMQPDGELHRADC